MSHKPAYKLPLQADEGTIWDAADHCVAVAMNSDFSKDDDIRNFAFLARCANSHAKLVAALRDVLPYAERFIERISDQMVGGLYPAINLAMIQRAKQALDAAEPHP